MSQISTHIDGEFEVSWHPQSPSILQIQIERWCGDEPFRFPYDFGSINIHGTPELFRDLATRILTVLPAQPAAVMAETETEPIEAAIAEVVES